MTLTEVERLRTENKYLREREAYIAKVLHVCDGGAYRVDIAEAVRILREDAERLDCLQWAIEAPFVWNDLFVFWGAFGQVPIRALLDATRKWRDARAEEMAAALKAEEKS